MFGSRRSRRFRLATTAAAAGLVPGWALAQDPIPSPPTGPVPVTRCRNVGPIRGAFRHVGRTLQSSVIGYPEEFVEPPLGFYLRENVAVMKAKAAPHAFTLYHSDFVGDSATLSPNGAQRLSLMARRLPCWLGPVVVEWTPDRPALAESRRAAIVAMLRGARLPVDDGRVVVGPSLAPGLMGTDAVANYNNLILRDAQAAQNFSLSPASTATLGSGGR